jgi:hypothetical protein
MDNKLKLNDNKGNNKPAPYEAFIMQEKLDYDKE